MFTTVDKALIALIMAVIYLLNTFVGLHIGLSQDQVTVVIGILTPILVYFVPNKQP